MPVLVVGALALKLAAAAELPGAAAAAAHAPAERLPVRVYTVDDGLAGDEVSAILQDSRGFLWIATDNGLSRFDGARFTGYDTLQGLPSPHVNVLAEDVAGGLLAGTTAGLARLDPGPAPAGGPPRGAAAPPAPPGGRAATGPAPRAFAPVPDASGRLRRRTGALLAAGGAVWSAGFAADGGLLRLPPPGRAGAGPEEVRLASGAPVPWVTALAPDGAGGLWVGERTGLRHRLAGGQWIDCPILPLPRWEAVAALLLDAQQRLWVETTSAVYVLKPGPAEAGRPSDGRLSTPSDGRLSTPSDGRLSPPPAGRPGAAPAAGASLLERAAAGNCRQPGSAAPRLPEAPGEVCRFDAASGLAGPRHAAPATGGAHPSGGMLQTRDGRIWIAGGGGLSEFDGHGFRGYTGRNGLPDDEITCLAEDRDGNLWAGTRSHGLMRMAHDGFLTYAVPPAAGLPERLGPPAPAARIAVAEFFEAGGSRLYVWGSHRGHPALLAFDGEQLADVTPEVLERAAYPERGRHQILAAETGGDLWLGAAAGIWRFPKVGQPALLRRAAGTFWRAPDDLGELFRLFADSRGRLWVSGRGSQEPAAGGRATTIARWDPGSGRFSGVPEIERLGRGAPSAFAEDPFGSLWIGFSGGGLARLRGETADLFLSGGVPAGAINDLMIDSRHRLWAATADGGALRIEGLDAARPRATVYGSAQGLSSDRILCVAEDRRGMIYLGHGKGIDRLDPQTGRVLTLTTADGLPSSIVNAAYRAADGSLWFGTPAGPARYLPDLPHSEAPPPIFLTGLLLNGVPAPMPALGARGLAGLELPAGRNHVEVRFTGISFAYGAGLRYQYRLDGSAAGWSEPQAERWVQLADLAPGSYRYRFRAVTPDHVASAIPATLAFTLPRPLWQRWWFLLPAAAAVVLLAWALHRAQLARLLELERVRTRIAADLHDDLSSSLARISILSELARRRLADPEALEATLVDQIGETARELMEMTGDIVWAIDARRDDLESLLARIRRFAGDLLEARGVNVAFASPAGAAGIALRPEAKRELYLVLKEAVHNAARHARAREVRIEVAATDGELVAVVRDDGVGFVAGGSGAGGGAGRSGHGLRNIRERAAKLGAKLSVDSAPGAGTCVRLSLRL